MIFKLQRFHLILLEQFVMHSFIYALVQVKNYAHKFNFILEFENEWMSFTVFIFLNC